MKKNKLWLRQRRYHWQDKYKMTKGCEICGYAKHPRALSFDHLDPKTKNVMIKNGGQGTKTRAGGMWQLTNPSIPISTLISEWRKCRVLCMNCHMEQRYKSLILCN
jgi:ribosomal protein L32